MKKTFGLFFLVALLCVPLLQAQAPSARTVRAPNTLSEREKAAGFELLFDGKEINSELWQGAIKEYKIVDGAMVCDPGGNILTKKEYADFVLRFEFKLPPGGNNGVGIRTKSDVNAAYDGNEIQVLDDGHEKYKDWLKDYQVHGSLYGVAGAKRGALKPQGEWNREEIIAIGNKIKVVVNGKTILDCDITEFIKGTKKPADGQTHVFNDKGVIGFLGHGDPVAFRSVRIKELKDEEDRKSFQ